MNFLIPVTVQVTMVTRVTAWCLISKVLLVYFNHNSPRQCNKNIFSQLFLFTAVSSLSLYPAASKNTPNCWSHDRAIWKLKKGCSLLQLAEMPNISIKEDPYLRGIIPICHAFSSITTSGLIFLLSRFQKKQ